VAASWNRIVDPPEGVISARRGYYSMIDKIEARDPKTVVFQLTFATAAFLPALADPYAFIYKGSCSTATRTGSRKTSWAQAHTALRNINSGSRSPACAIPIITIGGCPISTASPAFSPTNRQPGWRRSRATGQRLSFAGFPPSTRDELVAALGDQITVQESDWNCGNLITPNHKRKPFDDVRVRRALTLAIDRWRGAPALSKISVMKTVGGVGFPGSPLAATKEELEQIAGFWPDIEKSRAEARRLLKEAGAENLTFELLNRNVDQPYKFNGTWVIDQWSKIGLKVTQRVLPTGPFGEAFRSGDFDTGLDGDCQNIVNPLLDGTKYLPHSVSAANYGNYDDPAEIELYDRMLRETDFVRQRQLMRQFEKLVLDTEAHEIFLLWRYRIVPYRSYVKGWKVSPSHYVNQDLATIWLDK
jgi:peptide/nickel transport system substrate-binding protein